MKYTRKFTVRVQADTIQLLPLADEIAIAIQESDSFPLIELLEVKDTKEED